MFDSKTMCVTMILVGLILISFGIWVPDSFLPPAANLIVGIITVILNSVRLGAIYAAEED